MPHPLRHGDSFRAQQRDLFIDSRDSEIANAADVRPEAGRDDPLLAPAKANSGKRDFCGDCLSQEAGLVLAPADQRGFYGGRTRRRVLTYSPRQAWSGLSILTVRDLTVFSSTKWIKHVALYTIVAVGAIYYSPNLDGNPGFDDEAHIDQLVDLMKWLLQSVGALVAFVLGGFVISARDLWKERRENYARLLGATRHLLLQLTARSIA
jgi:hypothetical protein